MDSIKVLAATGMLGLGIPPREFEAGLAKNPDVVGVDSGSIDGGPSYLAEGTSGVGIQNTYRDLSYLLKHCLSRNIPLVIGSAAMAGGEPHIKIMLDLMERARAEGNLRDFTVAVIHNDVDKEYLKNKVRENKVKPMPGFVPEINDAQIDRSIRIVGQMGVTPFIEALRQKPDVVLAGRACDTAIYAAMPIMHGFDVGLSFHAAKIIECGAYATQPANGAESILATIYKDKFVLEPLHPDRACTPISVAAHTMYENDHPYKFTEPDGEIDCSKCVFEQISEKAVSCKGTKHISAIPGKGFIKLEGAAKVGYRSIAVVGSHDEKFIEMFDTIVKNGMELVKERIGSPEERGYSIQFRTYGRDAVLQSLETQPFNNHEIGIVIDVVAKTQEEAKDLCALIRSMLMHTSYPGRKTVGGNIAVSFSPGEVSFGAVYEFNIFHLVEVEDLNELFPIEMKTIGGVV